MHKSSFKLFERLINLFNTQQLNQFHPSISVCLREMEMSEIENQTSNSIKKVIPMLPRSQWLNIAEFYKKNIVFYQDSVLQINDLMSIHPGGSQLLINYRNKDITSIFFKVYPHTQQALCRLKKYQIGKCRKHQIGVSFKQIQSIDPETQKTHKKNCIKDIVSKNGSSKSNIKISSNKKVTFKVYDQNSSNKPTKSRNKENGSLKKKPRVSIQIFQQEQSKQDHIIQNQQSQNRMIITSSRRNFDDKNQLSVPIFQAKFMGALQK